MDGARQHDEGSCWIPLTRALIRLHQSRRRDLIPDRVATCRKIARDDFEAAGRIAQCPEDIRAMAWNNAAALSEYLNDRPGALGLMEKVSGLKPGPGYQAVLRNRAILCLLAGKTTEARNALETYLQKSPDDAGAQQALQRIEAPPAIEEEKEKKP